MMKSIGVAAAVTLALSIGPAFADQGSGTHPNTLFTEIPGVVAHPPHYTGTPPVIHPNKGIWYYSEDLEQYAFPPRYTHVYGTESRPSTFLVPPDSEAGAGS